MNKYKEYKLGLDRRIWKNNSNAVADCTKILNVWLDINVISNQIYRMIQEPIGESLNDRHT